MQPPCGGKRLRLCFPQACSSRKLRRDTCLHNLNGYDKTSDALYFRLDESAIVDSEEVRPGVILDFNEHGQVVGVEFLGIHARTTEHELTSLHFETT